MAKFYCKYCGRGFDSVGSLTFGMCDRHPDGTFRGHHGLYEGAEKTQYACKFCGQKFNSIRALTFGRCVRHPAGPLKGPHSPAL